MTMDELKPGQSAFISAVGGDGALRHHLLDMGLTPQTEEGIDSAVWCAPREVADNLRDAFPTIRCVAAAMGRN